MATAALRRSLRRILLPLSLYFSLFFSFSSPVRPCFPSSVRNRTEAYCTIPPAGRFGKRYLFRPPWVVMFCASAKDDDMARPGQGPRPVGAGNPGRP